MEATSTSTEASLIRTDQNGIATLRLNRPNAMNCLSEALIEALESQFDRIANDQAVKCVIIAGSGRAFCAGHDLREMQRHATQEYYRKLFAKCSRMMLRIRSVPVPVIASVHGDATAAGCQLVAACDLAVASTTARFAAAGVNIGSFCATPAVAITRSIAPKQAFKLLFTGRLFDAHTAAAWGLVNDVVPPDQLEATVQQLAADIASKSATALRFGKSQFYQQRDMALEDAYAFASEGMACNLTDIDAVEGIDAFLSKRKPIWRN